MAKTKKVVRRKNLSKKATRVSPFIYSSVDGENDTRFSLSNGTIHDTGNYQRKVRFIDLAASLSLIQDKGLEYAFVAGTSEYNGRSQGAPLYKVEHNVTDRVLRIGCQTFVGEAYDRLLQKIVNTSLYPIQ